MKQILLAAVFAVFTVALAPHATAQSLEEGRWTGTMEAPDGDVVDLTYEVKKDGDVLTIALLPPEGVGADADRYEFSDVRMEDGNLVFWWQPGPRVDCVLEPVDDGAYDGECSVENGESGFLTMVPPGEDGDAGHDEDDGHGDDHDKDEGHDED
jgi:hypothetical protein